MNNTNEGISFIMPAYNCATTIQESVESIMNGNFEPEDELIIVNDCSTDATLDVIHALQAKYPSITVLDHKINKGTAAAGRNTGIEQAHNTLIFCLDADNILTLESVPKLKDHLLATGADAAAFGELHYFKESPEKVTHKWVFREIITLADALAGGYWPGPSGNYLFTKQSWLKAGRYFEPTLLNQTLDSCTFGILQLGTGAKMVTLPNSYYLHRYGYSSHYIRERKRGNRSLAGLVALFPFLALIEDEDVDYIMSREGRYTWYDNLEKHPIRLKTGERGKSGTRPQCDPSQIHVLKKLLKRLLSLMGVECKRVHRN